MLTDLLLAALLRLLSRLLGRRHFDHFLFLVDPVLPVFLATLLQQSHSDQRQRGILFWANWQIFESVLASLVTRQNISFSIAEKKHHFSGLEFKFLLK